MLPILIALALGTAEPQGAAVAPGPPPAESAKGRKARARAEARAKIECRAVTPTGSNVPMTACFTRAEWDLLREQSQAEARAMVERSGDRGLGGR